MQNTTSRGSVLGFSLALRAATASTLIISASAATVVVPNASETNEGNSNDIAPLYRDSVTAVMVIASSQLGSMPIGSSINAIGWRLDGSVNNDQPNNVRNFADYEIHLGQAAVTPGTMQSAVADNYASGTRTQVRDGALQVARRTIDAASSGVAPFDFEISFDTPYVYTGGDLVIEYSHTGSNRNFVAFDGLTIPGPAEINQWVALSFGAANVSQDNSVGVPQLNYTPPSTPIPEPAALTFAGIGMLLMQQRRRHKRWRPRIPRSHSG